MHYRSIRWSKEEEDALKKLYSLYLKGLVSDNDLEKVFQHRTLEAIKSKARRMRLIKLEDFKINKKEYHKILTRIKI